jgi:hypothetical protein
VFVGVDVGVSVAAVPVGTPVLVAVAVGVFVGAATVLVAVLVGVFVGAATVFVAVLVGVFVAADVDVAVAVAVLVGATVLVGVDVDVGVTLPSQGKVELPVARSKFRRSMSQECWSPPPSSQLTPSQKATQRPYALPWRSAHGPSWGLSLRPPAVARDAVRTTANNRTANQVVIERSKHIGLSPFPANGLCEVGGTIRRESMSARGVQELDRCALIYVCVT